MQLSKVDALAGTSYVGSEREAMYEARLESAISMAQKECNQSFENDEGVIEMPGGVQMGVALIVKAMGESQNVQSQSLGDMSKSFFENGTYKSALLYFKPFRKVGYK